MVLEKGTFLLTKESKEKLKFAKAIYGVKAHEENKTVKYGNKILVAWCLVGSDTLAELEKKFSDVDIYFMFLQTQTQI